MNDEARKKLERLANEDPEKFKRAIFGLNIERDASIKGWLVEVIMDNGDFVKIEITTRKLKDMSIEASREDIGLHIDALLSLPLCSEIK